MSGTPPVADSTASSTAGRGSSNAPAAQASAGQTQPVYFHLLSYIAGALTMLAITGGGFFLLQRPDPPPIEIHPAPTPQPTASPTATATPGPIVVFVSGAVQQTGTYTLPYGARVVDALVAAGGLRPEADPSLVNQAARVFDGAQVYVPARGTAATPAIGLSGVVIDATSAAQATDADLLVNLNTATQEQLETLPGIGASKAAAIIANRPYGSVDDLDRVPGIGSTTLDRLRPLVTVQ